MESQTVPAKAQSWPLGELRIWIVPAPTEGSPVENTYQFWPGPPATRAGSWVARSPVSPEGESVAPAVADGAATAARNTNTTAATVRRRARRTGIIRSGGDPGSSG